MIVKSFLSIVKVTKVRFFLNKKTNTFAKS